MQFFTALINLFHLNLRLQDANPTSIATSAVTTVTRYWNPKQPNFVQKYAQKVVTSNFCLKRDIFENSLKSPNIQATFVSNLVASTIKKLPIRVTLTALIRHLFGLKNMYFKMSQEVQQQHPSEQQGCNCVKILITEIIYPLPEHITLRYYCCLIKNILALVYIEQARLIWGRQAKR